MYDLFSLAGMEGLWKSLYCHGDYSRCRRYQDDSAGKTVPQHMLPDGQLLNVQSIRPPARRGGKR